MSDSHTFATFDDLINTLECSLTLSNGGAFFTAGSMLLAFASPQLLAPVLNAELEMLLRKDTYRPTSILRSINGAKIRVTCLMPCAAPVSVVTSRPADTVVAIVSGQVRSDRLEICFLPSDLADASWAPSQPCSLVLTPGQTLKIRANRDLVLLSAETPSVLLELDRVPATHEKIWTYDLRTGRPIHSVELNGSSLMLELLIVAFSAIGDKRHARDLIPLTFHKSHYVRSEAHRAIASMDQAVAQELKHDAPKCSDLLAKRRAASK